MILPVTLMTLAGAALLSVILMLRCGRVRMKAQVMHGDGDNPLLARRMRAQLNFVETAPFVLLLIAAVELTGYGEHWLGWVAALYLAGRVGHMLGMDGEGVNPGRLLGTMVTMLSLLGLGILSALIALGVI